MSVTSLAPVCDQDSLMEFGLDQLRTGLRFEAIFNYAILVVDLVADLQRAGIWPITHYLAR